MASEHKLRLVGLAWLAALLLWLPVEDTKPTLAFWLGVLGSLWIGARALWQSQIARLRWRNALLGTGWGLVTPLASSALMLFKTGLHAHGFNDFSGTQLWQVLRLAPPLAIIGLLVGILLDRIKRGMDGPN